MNQRRHLAAFAAAINGEPFPVQRKPPSTEERLDLLVFGQPRQSSDRRMTAVRDTNYNKQFSHAQNRQREKGTDHDQET